MAASPRNDPDNYLSTDATCMINVFVRHHSKHKILSSMGDQVTANSHTVYLQGFLRATGSQKESRRCALAIWAERLSVGPVLLILIV